MQWCSGLSAGNRACCCVSPRCVGAHRQVERCAGHQLLAVKIAAVLVARRNGRLPADVWWRRGGEHAEKRNDVKRAPPRRACDVCGRIEACVPQVRRGRPLERPAKRSADGPRPVGSEGDFEDVDAQHIAGLCAAHMHRAGEQVHTDAVPHHVGMDGCRLWWRHPSRVAAAASVVARVARLALGPTRRDGVDGDRGAARHDELRRTCRVNVAPRHARRGARQVVVAWGGERMASGRRAQRRGHPLQRHVQDGLA